MKKNRHSLIIVSVLIVGVLLSALFVPSASAEDDFLGALPDNLYVKINNREKLVVKKPVTNTYELYNGATLEEVEEKNVTQSCRLSVENEEIATVSEDGVIHGRALGSTLLSVRFYDREKNIRLFVTESDPDFVAHRGAMDYAPENTLYAFSKAVELGYDRFEFDANPSNDGTLYVLHDFDLIKMCGVDKALGEVTLAERHDYPITNGVNVDKIETQYIPLVDEVLDFIAKTPSLSDAYIHLKKIAKTGGWNEKMVADLSSKIRNRGLCGRVTVCSSRKTELKYFARDIKTAVLTTETDAQKLISLADWAVENGVEGILQQYNSKALPPAEFVTYAHDKGLRLASYTITDSEQVANIKSSGMDEILSNCVLFE